MNGRRPQKFRHRLKPYEDSSHRSGVSAYEAGDDFIAVQFKSGDIYIYDYPTTGRTTVEKMKRLAESGHGLSTFISQEVRESYAARI